MTDKYVINIGRQLGSGGLLIGEKLSKRLGINFYDKELLREASKESGLSKKFFEQADEKSRFGWFGNLFGWFSNPLNEGYLNDDYLRGDVLFRIQSEAIRHLAEKQSCLFIGRCADYVLRDHPRSLNIFISADLEDRIRRIADAQQISREKAQHVIEQVDKRRAGYYNYYSNKVWGAAASYHLCLNSSVLGIDDTVEFIHAFAEKKFGMKNLE